MKYKTSFILQYIDKIEMHALYKENNGGRVLLNLYYSNFPTFNH
jgi:hypothetical protein